MLAGKLNKIEKKKFEVKKKEHKTIRGMRFGLEYDLNDGDDKRLNYYNYSMIVLSNYNQFNIHLHIIRINYKLN